MILTIIGARPQFVKAAMVSPYIENEVILHTGQHYDDNMSKQFLDLFGIRPDYNLGLGGLSHGAMTGRMIEAIEETILRLKPDHVLLYGDTNSTLAGAIAAGKCGADIHHVEAGLRSFTDMPEEVNRKVADHLSHHLYCPSPVSLDNLIDENLTGEFTGDVMRDAILKFEAGIKPKKCHAICTIHRQENVEDPDKLSTILEFIDKIGGTLICHPRLRAKGLPPQSYTDMIGWIKGCDLVITDSGGLQREAFYLGKPSLIIREQTEWSELVFDGYAEVGDIDCLEEDYETVRMIGDFTPTDIYGDGKAGEKIGSYIMNL